MLNYFVFLITMCTWTYCLFYLWLHNKLLIFYDLTECPVGYYGIHCLRPSRYPSYGINCQQDCSECGHVVRKLAVRSLVGWQLVNKLRVTQLRFYTCTDCQFNLTYRQREQFWHRCRIKYQNIIYCINLKRTEDSIHLVVICLHQQKQNNCLPFVSLINTIFVFILD